MTHPSAPLATPEDGVVPSDPAPHLHGRWLILARVGWLVVVICSLALFVGSLPTYYLLLQRPCVGTVACTYIPASLDAAGVQALQAAGFSLSGYAAYTILLTITNMLIWVAIGLVIFWRRSEDWVALLAAFALVLAGLSSASGLTGVIGVLALAAPIWTFPAQMISFMGFAASILMVGLFPTGRFAPRWVGWVVALFLIEAFLSNFPPANSPLNANTWPVVILLVLYIGTFATLIFSQLYRYRRRSTPIQRQQIKWAVFGFVLALVLGIGVIFVEFVVVSFTQEAALLEAVINTLWLLTLLPIPIFLGVAILRSRLWDIDAIINKVLVYGLLTGLLGALYAGLIIGLTSLAGAISGQVNQPVVLVFSTLAIAALFLPVRRRIQAIIDHRFYRKKYDAAKTLEAFAATLRQETDLEQIRERLLAVVQETMQPTQVSLWLRPPERRSTEQAHRLEPREEGSGRPKQDGTGQPIEKQGEVLLGHARVSGK